MLEVRQAFEMFWMRCHILAHAHSASLIGQGPELNIGLLTFLAQEPIDPDLGGILMGCVLHHTNAATQQIFWHGQAHNILATARIPALGDIFRTAANHHSRISAHEAIGQLALVGDISHFHIAQ